MTGATDQKLKTLVDMALRDPDGNEGRNAAVKACRLMKEAPPQTDARTTALALQAMQSLFETQRVFAELRLDEARMETARAWAAWRRTRLLCGVLILLVATTVAGFAARAAWNTPCALMVVSCVYVVGIHYLLRAVRSTGPTP